jgi:hypothetical protein
MVKQHYTLSTFKRPIAKSVHVYCSIKKDFEDLLSENESRLPEERLPRSFFDIDPELRNAIKEETEEAERMAVEEMRWETEKANIALEKLKGAGKRLTASMRCESIAELAKCDLIMSLQLANWTE